MIRYLDTIVVISANAANLLLASMFLARVPGRDRLAHRLGVAATLLAIPVAVAIGLNAVSGRPWWMAVLPAPFVLFAIVEVVLDDILHIDFRATWMLAPYLVLYYVGLIALIGYAFAVGKTAGFVTLITYLVNLGCTSYSYRRVRHGRAVSSETGARS